MSLLEEQVRRLQAERDEVEERARRSAERDASLPTIMETHSHEAEAICEAADLEVTRLRSDLAAARAANERLVKVLNYSSSSSS